VSEGGFFADAAPPPRPQVPAYRTPPWLAPPDNVLPGTVALGTILAQTEGAAVWLADGRAYPDGLALTVATRVRDPETRVTLDASEVVAAAARAIELWPDDRPLPPAERDVVV